VHVVVGVPDRNPVDTGVSSTLGEMRCRSPNTVSRSPGVGIIAGWDDLLHFVDYERTALGCFDGGVGCGAQESGQSEQSSDLDFLGIGQCFDLIDTESVSTASNLVSSNDRRAGTFATDQHRQGIVQKHHGPPDLCGSVAQRQEQGSSHVRLADEIRATAGDVRTPSRSR
jgi:hypothetical protein